MSAEFINPNWHVILIHYPIGLLTAGVLVELVSLAWRDSAFRTAGRWMILLGAVLSIPTAVAGIYAFRDVVLAGPVHPHTHWYQIVESSDWGEKKWLYITWHLWLNGAATIIFLLVTGLWVVLSDRWRVKLYWPMLILLIAGLGIMSVGAWYGGEAVYELGTGIKTKESSLAESQAAAHESKNETGEEEGRSLTYYLPPLQLHVVLAGFVFALTFVALAVALFRPERAPPRETAAREGSRLRPAWFWLAGAAVAFAVALAGVWATNGGEWSSEAFEENFRLLSDSDYSRLLLHLLIGGIIFLLLLLSGLAAWKRPSNAALSLSLAILLCLSLFAQLWLGILMLYDSRRGPLLEFVSAPPAQRNVGREKQAEEIDKRAEPGQHPTTPSGSGHH